MFDNDHLVIWGCRILGPSLGHLCSTHHTWTDSIPVPGNRRETPGPTQARKSDAASARLAGRWQH